MLWNKQIATFCAAVALLAFPRVGHAETIFQGPVDKVFSYQTHSGLLVHLSNGMADADRCGRTDFFIFPDNALRAQFVQALLLTKQSTPGSLVTLVVSGCLEGFPKIVHVSAP